MEALVSGQAGAAAVLGRDGQIRRLGEAPLPGISQHLLGRFFAGSTDIRHCAAESGDELDAVTHRAWSSDRALRMFLMLIDSSEPEEALVEYAACLEELLAESDAEVFTRKNMYSEPLPASVNSTQIAAILDGHAKSSRLFACLLRDQTQIAQVRNSFDAVPPALFGDPESKLIVLEAAIAHGAFVDLVDALNRNADVNLVVLKLLAQLRHVKGAREIVEQWTSGMRKPRVSAAAPILDPAEESEQLDESRFAAALDRALANFQQRRRRSKEGSAADLPAIQREISWIGTRLKLGDAVGAEQALATLIERQGRRSRMEDIIKTLTSVADLARSAKLFDFTLRILASIERIGNLDAAAACVRAETLRDLGRHEEALAAFEDTMRRFPQNEVAPTARAETLGDLGRREEALAAFEDTMQRFPENEVVRNARAETLRDLGRHEEALAAFEDTMRRFPQNEVAATARAETLGDLGRYEEALAAFEDTMRRFPQNEVGRRAYAHLLGSRGAIAEVEELLAPAVARLGTSGDWIAAHILAMARLRVGRVDEALTAIERGVQSCPSREQRRYFETARPLALLAKQQAAEAAQQLATLAAISTLPQEEKTNIVLFQAHALAEAGESDRARDIVESAQIVDFAAARQRKLAEAITERYGLVSGVPASDARAEELSGTISMLEFDLVRPKLWTFRAGAVRAA